MLSPTDALRLDCCLELLALLSLAPQSSVALQCADFSETLEQALGASGGTYGCLSHRGFNLPLQPLFLKGVATAD